MLQAETCNFIKKKLWHWHLPVNFRKYLRTSFFYRAPSVAASENGKTRDKGSGFAALLTDLAKAFDCLLDDLLIS